MEAGFIVMIVVTAIISIVAGIHIEKTLVKRRAVQGIQGVLNVICNDPEHEPQLFLQLIVPIEDVISREQTTFDVNVIR